MARLGPKLARNAHAAYKKLQTSSCRGPAMKIVAEFKNDNGRTVRAEFDREAGQVVTPNGASSYKRISPTQLEIAGADNLTLTFESEVKFEPGFTTRYAGTMGAGLCTIVSAA